MTTDQFCVSRRGGRVGEKLCPGAGRAKFNEHPPGVCVLHVCFTFRACLYMIRTHAFPPYDALEPRRLARRLGNSTVARLASCRPSDRTQPADNPHSSRHHGRKPQDQLRCHAHGSGSLSGPPPRMPCPWQLPSWRSSAGWAKRARPRKPGSLRSQTATNMRQRILPLTCTELLRKDDPRP